MNKLCFYNRSSIHYRKNIYQLLDREMQCDFYFGDSRPGKIKPVDESLLEHVKPHLHNVNLAGPWYWQKGALGLLRKDYTDILTPGETYCLSSWMVMFLAPLFGKRVYIWTHGAYGDEKGIKLLMTRWRMKLCTGAFLYGNYAKELLKGYGVDEKKLHVIYNSLAYDEQMEIRRELQESTFYKDHFGNDCPNLVFIGRLTKVKKLDQILRALSKLQELGKHYNLTFVGDGVVKDELIRLTEKLGLQDHVWYYGACYDEKQISEFLYNADLCVSPGNVGLTAMHAMVFGCPVISHDNFVMQMPEFEAIEKGLTGDFFREDDISDLARSIGEWFAAGHDRETVRKACFGVIDEKYNPHKQIETFKNVINR